VFNGTAANVLSILAASKPYNYVICSDLAHIFVDESTAPEKITSCRIKGIITGIDGKLDADLVKQNINRAHDEHSAQPGVVSITQATEVGTVYTPDEIQAITQVAHSNDMFVHMDGARLFNAAASLNLPVKAITADVGVDVVSVGGTKNGMMFGEAIVFLNKDLAKNFKYYRKQNMQLFSKMRYISAQFVTMLSNDLAYKNARQANAMANLLYNQLQQIEGITITRPVQANGVFAVIPSEITEELQDVSYFYIWDEKINEIRLMCSYDIVEADIINFSEKLKILLKNKKI